MSAGETAAATPFPRFHPLSAVLGATFFVRFAFGITISIFASYILGTSQGIGADSVGTVGLIAAMAPIGEFSTVLISGTVADRRGRFPVLFVGMASASALFALVALTRNPYLLGGLNLFFGVSSGAILASSLAVVADHSPRRLRGFEMGRFDAVNLLGWIVGYAFGLGLLQVVPNGQLGEVFLVGAAILGAGLTLAVYLSTGVRESPAQLAHWFHRVRAAVLRRDVLLVATPWLVIYMLIGTGLTFLATAASGNGVPTGELAILIGGGGLLLLATQPYFGRLSDRFGRMRLMLVGTVGFAGVMASAAALLAYGAEPAILAAAGVSILAALAYGPAALAALTDLSESITRATTMAIYTLVISLGMILGLAVSTQLYSKFGNLGLDGFFALVGGGLVTLTALRYQDIRMGRTGGQLEPAT